MTKKKKFPSLPRPGGGGGARSKKSEQQQQQQQQSDVSSSSSAAAVVDDSSSNWSEPSSNNGGGISGPSSTTMTSSPTTTSTTTTPRRSPFAGRKPSFRFGRRRNNKGTSSPSPPPHSSSSGKDRRFSPSARSDHDDGVGELSPRADDDDDDPSPPIVDGGDGDEDPITLPPPLPRTTTVASVGMAIDEDVGVGAPKEDVEKKAVDSVATAATATAPARGGDRPKPGPLLRPAGRRPPPTPRAQSTPLASMTSITTRTHKKSPSLPPPALPASTRTRSLTPSDYHYHTTPSGGCNAPLAPITKHYETNDALLDLFTTLYESGSNGENENDDGDKYSVAYAVGIKFVEVALFRIPQHGYYRSGSASGERTKSAADAVRVTELLGSMTDEEEESSARAEMVRKLSIEARKSLEEALDDGRRVGKKDKKAGGGGDDDQSAANSRAFRSWKDYIMGGGSGDGLTILPVATSNLCSALSSDGICSFLSIGKADRYAVDDDVVSAAQPISARDEHAKKRQRIDRQSLPRPPDPVEIPQVFIKKESQSMDVTMGEEKKDVAAMDVDESSTPKAARSSKAVVAGYSRQESAATIVTDDAADVVVNNDDNDASQPTVEDISKAKTPIHVNKAPYDEEVLHLALSRSMSGRERDVVPFVSSSSEDGVAPRSALPDLVLDSGVKKNDIASMISHYEKRYHALKEEGKFHVRFLDTFQGRNPGSTNGCTVIAPLTCIQYFTSEEQNRVEVSPRVGAGGEPQVAWWDGGVPDDLINQVVDHHAAAILPEVRDKLGLHGDAFIIPSDVHDHLIEVGLLSTTQFVGACGGNVLDDEHLASFRRSLLLLDVDEKERERLRGRKIGACFFFHGHVIAFHVVNGGSGGGNGKGGGKDDKWVELIDSLPNPETWIGRRSRRGAPGAASSSDSSDSHKEEGGASRSTTERRWSGGFHNGGGYSDDGEEWETPKDADEDEDELPLNAVRVRCTDADHLDVLVRHYACSKFSREEREFVDGTSWDDVGGYCESSFDPRVFQAFIWCEA